MVSKERNRDGEQPDPVYISDPQNLLLQELRQRVWLLRQASLDEMIEHTFSQVLDTEYSYFYPSDILELFIPRDKRNKIGPRETGFAELWGHFKASPAYDDGEHMDVFDEFDEEFIDTEDSIALFKILLQAGCQLYDDDVIDLDQLRQQHTQHNQDAEYLLPVAARWLQQFDFYPEQRNELIPLTDILLRFTPPNKRSPPSKKNSYQAPIRTFITRKKLYNRVTRYTNTKAKGVQRVTGKARGRFHFYPADANILVRAIFFGDEKIQFTYYTEDDQALSLNGLELELQRALRDRKPPPYPSIVVETQEEDSPEFYSLDDIFEYYMDKDELALARAVTSVQRIKGIKPYKNPMATHGGLVFGLNTIYTKGKGNLKSKALLLGKVVKTEPVEEPGEAREADEWDELAERIGIEDDKPEEQVTYEFSHVEVKYKGKDAKPFIRTVLNKLFNIRRAFNTQGVVLYSEEHPTGLTDPQLYLCPVSDLYISESDFEPLVDYLSEKRVKPRRLAPLPDTVYL